MLPVYPNDAVYYIPYSTWKREKSSTLLAFARKVAASTTPLSFSWKILEHPNLGNYVQQIEQYQRIVRDTPWIETEEHRGLKAGDRDFLRAAVRKPGFVESEANAVLNMLMQNSTEIADNIENYSRYCSR